MLRHSLRTTRALKESFRSFASGMIDPTREFDFIRAEPKDKGRLMDIALNQFIYVEPHSVALGLNNENMKDLIEWLVEKALHYPYSVALVEKSTGKMAGFRLLSMDNRDSSKTFIPFDLDLEKADEGVQILANVLDSVKKEIWRLRPEANKILRREITFVAPKHQRKGIAQYLLHLYLNFDELRADGVDGIQSEASSHANQRLLSKNGYEKLLDAERKEYVRKDGRPVIFPDETKCVQLFYKNLR